MTINIELPGPAAHRVIWRDGTDEPSNWTQYHDDSDPLPESWDDEVPDIVTPLYTADQVRAIVAADRAERAALADPVEPRPWDRIEDVFSVLSDARAGRWGWTENSRCKYIGVRIDMRSGHCIVSDRDDKRITLDELRSQPYGRGGIPWASTMALGAVPSSGAEGSCTCPSASGPDYCEVHTP